MSFMLFQAVTSWHPTSPGSPVLGDCPLRVAGNVHDTLGGSATHPSPRTCSQAVALQFSLFHQRPRRESIVQLIRLGVLSVPHHVRSSDNLPHLDHGSSTVKQCIDYQSCAFLYTVTLLFFGLPSNGGMCP